MLIQALTVHNETQTSTLPDKKASTARKLASFIMSVTLGSHQCAVQVKQTLRWGKFGRKPKS